MTNLPANIELHRYKRDLVYDFKLDDETDWLLNLLIEMNESSGTEQEEFLKNSVITVEGTLKVVNVPQFQDVLLIDLSFHAKYLTIAVNDLKQMKQTLDYETSLCFVHNSFQDDEAYKEETEIFIENKMRELYFCEKGKANLSEALHEQTFLNFNFYPTNAKEEPHH